MTAIGLVSSVGLTLDSFFPEIVDEWRRQGVRVVSAAGSEARTMPSHAVLPGITRAPSLRQNYAALEELRGWARTTSPDVIITNTATASALVRAAKLRIPVVYFCHGLHWSGGRWTSPHWRIIERALLKRTAAVITLNAADESWFSRYFDARRVTRLRWGVGVDTERFPRTPLPSEGNLLVWAGEFSGRKNPMAALEVMRSLHMRQPHLRLAMLGDGELIHDCRAYVEREGLTSVVEMPGRTDPVPYLTRASLVLHTSAWEGLPRILLEALAIGRPVVGFAAKGVSDLPIQTVFQGDVNAMVSSVEDQLVSGAQMRLPETAELGFSNAAAAILKALRLWRFL